MELHQLKYFVRLADCLSFTGAAKECFVTQSTLSTSISKLEEEFGIKLFDRIGRKVFLSNYGRAFLPYARSVLADLENGVREINTMNEKACGVFTVGATFSAMGLLTPVIAELSRLYPLLQIRVKVFNTVEEIMAALLENRIDLAISYRPDTLPNGVDEKEVYKSRISVIASSSHPWAMKKSVETKDIIRQSVVTFPLGSYTRSLIDRIMRKERIEFRPQAEIDDTGCILSLVATGKWITLLASGSILNSQAFTAIPLKGHAESLQISAMWLSGKTLTSLCRQFIDVLSPD